MGTKGPHRTGIPPVGAFRATGGLVGWPSHWEHRWGLPGQTAAAEWPARGRLRPGPCFCFWQKGPRSVRGCIDRHRHISMLGGSPAKCLRPKAAEKPRPCLGPGQLEPTAEPEQAPQMQPASDAPNELSELRAKQVGRSLDRRLDRSRNLGFEPAGTSRN